MKDKSSILLLAPSARKFNAAITRHLPLAFQQQRKALLEKAKRLQSQENTFDNSRFRILFIR